jgi:2-oxo-4-hydroxy-4-carboxy--5-ureidoimidazoline (OHCU) decarboxylase
LKTLLLAVLIFMFPMAAIAQSSSYKAAAEKAHQASITHLKVCHELHQFLIEAVEESPTESPLDVIKKAPDSKRMAASCAENAKEEIDNWQSLNDTQQKQQEKGLGQELGFSFDELMQEYNFFNILSSHLNSWNTN